MTEIAVREEGALSLLTGLERAGAMTAVSLDLSEAALDFERWEALGRMLGAVRRSSAWWIADWLNFGEAVYGERYAQAEDVTGLDHGTMLTYAYVGRSVPRSRRREELSFSCHRIVAALEPAQQTKWLDKAVAGDGEQPWSSRDLRAAMNEANALAPPQEQPLWDNPPPVDSAAVIRAALAVLHAGTPDGDAMRVPLDTWARLQSTLGEGE